MGVISGNHCKISFPFQTVLPCDTLSCAHNWWIKADKLCTLSFQVPYTHSRFTHTSPLCSMLLSIKQQHMHSRTIHWKLIENFEILASTLVFPPRPQQCDKVCTSNKVSAFPQISEIYSQYLLLPGVPDPGLAARLRCYRHIIQE